jgi:leucyl-tRNA synthetase
MAEYPFSLAEKAARDLWEQNKVYETKSTSNKPKYYVLDMFPYPSGAGLHVGHPLGYIASDIVSRYKRMQGFNVLHPMGFDAFGLPAEQYAIQTGQHPELTTKQNIARYKEQLDAIGLSFDWSRAVETSDPSYYRWTQWIFIQLFNSWYDKTSDSARPLDSLISEFENNGNLNINAHCSEETPIFTAQVWKDAGELLRSELLMHYRLAYQAEARVNWCPALGTVLANDEVKDGLSERGGYPVEIRMMRQWMMRISAYSQRLLDGLAELDWSDAIKEQQRNWIGRSEGALIRFAIQGFDEKNIEVFTTRPDTIFGVSFMVLAPEHDLVDKITASECRAEVDAYVSKAKNRSERERMADVKSVSGAFTGAYAIHPFTSEPIPIWIADYVLAGYGTGAVMAVPGGDERDWRFARHYGLPIYDVIEGSDLENGANSNKDAKIINSDFLNGFKATDAIAKAVESIEQKGIGKGRVQFRLRDAIFSRQRYWGEPLPIYFDNGIAKALPDDVLPLTLPQVDKYLPTAEGEPPLARAENWHYKSHPLETTTMPGWAGSSWYFLRYMDPKNEIALAEREVTDYWNQVDLYVGGSEHATGHLLYSRFWNHFLYDIGLIGFKEPFRKLVNQGMIQGKSNFVFRVEGENKFVSAGLRHLFKTTAIHVDVNLVKNEILNVEAFQSWREEYKNSEFIMENAETGELDEKGIYRCTTEVEKMSKSKWNVVNPDDIIEQYGADTLRLYEMFLGPIEDAKPWDTSGIEGVFRFLNKTWRLFHEGDIFKVSDENPNEAELKVLHRTIRKVQDDIDRFSFNTCVSAFMICVNELQSLKCNKRAVLEPFLKLLSPFAPFITENLWQQLGHSESITTSAFPTWDNKFLIEDTYSYPVQENGKMRFTIDLPKNLDKDELENLALNHEKVTQLLMTKRLNKIVVVPGRIVNLVTS